MCGETDVYLSAPQPFPMLMGLKPVVRAMVAAGVCHSAAAAAARYAAASDICSRHSYM